MVKVANERTPLVSITKHPRRRITDSQIESLKSRVNLVEVADMLGLNLQRTGKSHFALCPFHSESTPSFSIFHGNQGWKFKCLGCGEHGDVIKLVQLINNISFVEAFDYLEGLAVSRPEISVAPPPVVKTLTLPIERQNEIRFKAALYYNEKLWSEEGKKARDYLDNRGLLDKDLLTKLLIGYAPKNNHNEDLIKATDATFEELGACNLANINVKGCQQTPMYNRIVFPVFQEGSIIGFQGRIPDNTTKKGRFYNSCTMSLFNADAIKINDSQDIHVFEGIPDCLTGLLSGLNATAILGTNGLTEDIVTLLNQSDKTKYYWFDNDQTGQAAIQKYGADLTNAKFIQMDVQEKDLNKYFETTIQSEGREKSLTLLTDKVRKWVGEAKSFQDLEFGNNEHVLVVAKAIAEAKVQNDKSIVNKPHIIEAMLDLYTNEIASYESLIGRMKKDLKLAVTGYRKKIEELARKRKKEEKLRIEEEEKVRKKEKMLEAESTEIARRILEIQISDNPKAVKVQLGQQALIQHLAENGDFFRANTGDMYYFLNRALQLMHLDEKAFEYHVANETNTPETDSFTANLIARVRSYAYKHGTKVKIRKLSYYDESTNTLYIDMFDGHIVKITSDRVQTVPNGTDEVLFLANSDWMPWQLKDNYEKGCFQKYLLSANFQEEDNPLNRHESIFTIQSWILSGFFREIMVTRPFLFFLGETQSGKSSYSRQFLQWMFGDMADVVGLSNHNRSEEAVDTAITTESFVTLDNLDTPIPWLVDKLCTIATGGIIPRRKLFTTNEMAKYPIISFTMLTARTPQFKRDDISNRLLVIKLDKIINKKGESARIRKLSSLRNDLWSEFVYMSKDIIKSISSWGIPDNETSFRIADFANFMTVVARTNYSKEKFFAEEVESGGIKGVDSIIQNFLVPKLEKLQAEFLVTDDPLTELLKMFLEDGNRYGKKLEPSELHKALSLLAREREIKYSFKSPASLSKQLKQLKDALKKQDKIELLHGSSNGKRYFEFRKI